LEIVVVFGHEEADSRLPPGACLLQVRRSQPEGTTIIITTTITTTPKIVL
jgi:hypothetical protein